jgi:hypothetical protein
VGGSSAAGGAGGAGGAGAGSLVVVSFNTGTTEGLAHDADPSDGYTSAEAAISDQWYGDGLAWPPAIAATTSWFAALQPDIVVFQEIFYSGDCTTIPPQFRTGWVCEGWAAGAPTVAQTVLGSDYQVACHLGKNDKCAAVRKAVGSIRGCNGDLCLDGLDGATVQNCGSGSRVGRGVIDLADGGELTIVNVHGTSGVVLDDQACRIAQFEQAFLDLDGQPGANGTRNIVLGDLNTDPGRSTAFDLSASRFNDFVGDGKTFAFHSDVGNNATPTYSGLLNIDHVTSDSFTGGCWTAGVTAGHPAVYDPIYFDHNPIVCELSAP